MRPFFPTNLIFFPLLATRLVRVVLEHSLAVGLLQAIVADAASILLEPEDLVVRQLRDELWGKIITEVKLYLLPNLLQLFTPSRRVKCEKREKEMEISREGFGFRVTIVVGGDGRSRGPKRQF